MEEFEAMPDRMKYFYIASEEHEFAKPCRNDSVSRGGF